MRGILRLRERQGVLLVVFLSLAITEYFGSGSFRAEHSLLREIVEIDATNPPDINGFVYTKFKGIQYETYFDERTNISVFGGYMGFSVMHCQYQETDPNLDSAMGWVAMPSIRKVWTARKIDSNRFFDRNARNPITPDFESWVKYQNVTIGNLTLSSEIFSNIRPFQFYALNEEEEQNFTESSLAKDGFSYIGHGYFYRPYQGREKMEAALKNLEENMPEAKRRTIVEKFLSSCTAGDIRARYALFAARNVTVVAWKQGNLLMPGKYKGYTFGSVSYRGETAEELLDVSFITAASALLPLKFVIFAVVRSMLMTLYDPPMIYGMNMFGVGLLALTVRSLVLNGGFYNPNLWGGLLVVYAVVYMALRRSRHFMNWVHRRNL